METSPVAIGARTRQVLFASFFFAILLLLLYQFYQVFSFFLAPLTWAAVLALVFYPLYSLVHRGLRGYDNLAAFLFTTAVILIVIVPTIILSLLLVRESVQFVQWAREIYESGRFQDWIEALRQSAPGTLWEGVAPVLREWRIDPATAGLRAGDAASKFLVEQVAQAAANALEFVSNFFFVTFALFFFFRDGERLVMKFRDLLPMESRHKDAIFLKFYEALSAVVQGTLITAGVQGVLAGIGFWFLSVPFAVLLGGVTAFLSILPFGTSLPWIGAAIYLAFSEEYLRAILLTGWGVLIIGSADNVIRPLIIGERTQIPTVFLFFAILGGLRAYGFLGVFLGPVLIAILVAVLRIYREEYAGVESLGENGDASPQAELGSEGRAEAEG